MKRKRVYPAHKRRAKSSSDIDKTLLILIFALLGIGLIAIYDATVILSQDLFGSAYHFVFLQVAWIVVGFVGFYVAYTVDLGFLKKIARPLFIITVVLLAILAVFGVLPCEMSIPFAECVNGANRWFYLNPKPLPEVPFLRVLQFQPAELAKLSLILYLSVRIEKSMRHGKAFLDTLIVVGIISALIVAQPNLSTALLIFAVGFTIYFASGAELKPLIISGPIFGGLGVLFMLVFSHTRERVMTFLFLSKGASETTGYHIKQILIALGSGGFMGVGLGQSRQKFQYLPEVFADSIFAIIGEELGFVGTTALAILFAALIYKGYSIAKDSNTVFGRSLATGITTWLALQFFVNVGAMTKLIPLTGMPLPLISYGGSSLIFALTGLGVLANVSKSNR